MSQLGLFDECTQTWYEQVRYGWRSHCSCGWSSWVLDVKWMARDELHAHLQETLRLTAATPDTTV